MNTAMMIKYWADKSSFISLKVKLPGLKVQYAFSIYFLMSSPVLRLEDRLKECQSVLLKNTVKYYSRFFSICLRNNTYSSVFYKVFQTWLSWARISYHWVLKTHFWWWKTKSMLWIPNCRETLNYKCIEKKTLKESGKNWTTHFSPSFKDMASLIQI